VNPFELDYVGVKVPMFSYGRLRGADPLLGVEMASTGEVGCIASTFNEALLLGLQSVGFRAPRAGVLLSLGPPTEKFSFADEALVIRDELGLPIYATAGTARMLRDIGIECEVLGKGADDENGAVRAIERGKIDLVVNLPVEYDQEGRPDGYAIRRAAIDAGIALFTDLQLARAVVEMLRQTGGRLGPLKAVTDFVNPAGR
jgi:carbamoyl-phosphate synthase large subunit